MGFRNLVSAKLRLVPLVAALHYSVANPQDVRPVGSLEKVGPIQPVGPIEPVGRIDPVGPIDPVEKSKEGSKHRVNTVSQIACWCDDLQAKNPNWHCTLKSEDNQRLVLEFTESKRVEFTKNGKKGDAFGYEVLKGDWGDKEARAKLIRRIETDILPNRTKKLLGKNVALRNIDWVDIKPVLSREERKALNGGKPSGADRDKPKKPDVK